MIDFLSNLGIHSGTRCYLRDRKGTFSVWGFDWNARLVLVELETNWDWFPAEKVRIETIEDYAQKLDDYKQSANDPIVGVDWLDNRVLQVMPKYIDWINVNTHTANDSEPTFH
ncbi:hypothetical protein OCT63_20555 [Vibrio sp. RW]|uniref:hypothetical protein n=1 Tax=Vibrio sp. RW TaxID=2998833 RepID=UPI0022CD2EAD|nr:hypothetical protein [Vibrio sp. RW]MDA0146616.1 hypothetical protein [Vibrio sp. RW]